MTFRRNLARVQVGIGLIVLLNFWKCLATATDNGSSVNITELISSSSWSEYYRYSFREEDSPDLETQVLIENCTDVKSSPLDQFPETFTLEQLRNGAVILYVLGAIYFFTLLAIVTNDYFLPTVDCICSDLGIPKHLAAATFMATATAMPEFFTNVISTVITSSDIGLGTIIGSLMFNTLGVAGVSALAVRKPMQLDWYPVTRDCFLFIFNILLLVGITWGDTVTFVESLIMVMFLLVYYVIIFLNQKCIPCTRVLFEDKMNCCQTIRYDLTQPPEYSTKAALAIEKNEIEGSGIYIIETHNPHVTTKHSTHNNSSEDNSDLKNNSHHEEDTRRGVFQISSEDSWTRKCWWVYSLPLKIMLRCMIPDPISHRKWYPLTFIMCIIIIGSNAYMIVWMLTVIGVTIKVPEIVMGLTFIAVGSTTPEALSSIISIRKGETGIAVSNSLGTNSLAILLSLALPWLIENIRNYNVEGENYIRIHAQGIEGTVLILLLSTLTLYVVLTIGGFRLRRRIGVILLTAYVIYISIQVLIEMNVFFPRQDLCL